MDRAQLIEFKTFLHSVTNPLNSITLHAELGKMLIDDNASDEELRKAFIVILQQCKACDKEISHMRKIVNDNL